MLEELQQKRNTDEVKADIDLLIRVDRQIAYFLSLKWQISMTGPTLMNIEKAQEALEVTEEKTK